MTCRNCNTEHNGKFCPNCGTPSYSGEQMRGPSPSANSTPAKKPITKRWWFWVIVVVFGIGILGNLGGNVDNNQDAAAAIAVKPESKKSSVDTVEASDTPEPTSVPTPSSTPTPSPEPTIDLSALETEYTLTAGNYVAGIDIPSGKCAVVAVSGQGNLSSSNMYSGGINEMFGVDDGSGFYTTEFNGLKLPEGTILTVGGTVKINLTFSAIETGFTGRVYDETKAIELSTGNYESGVDFPEGVYKIVAIKGTGNLSSDNMFSGGLNEMFGIDDGYGFYVGEFYNVDLPAGTELSVSGGVKIQLIPASLN